MLAEAVPKLGKSLLGRLGALGKVAGRRRFVARRRAGRRGGTVSGRAGLSRARGGHLGIWAAVVVPEALSSPPPPQPAVVTTQTAIAAAATTEPAPVESVPPSAGAYPLLGPFVAWEPRGLASSIAADVGRPGRDRGRARRARRRALPTGPLILDERGALSEDSSTERLPMWSASRLTMLARSSA